MAEWTVSKPTRVDTIPSMLLKDQKPILILLLFFVFYFLLFEGTMTETEGGGGKMKTEKKRKKPADNGNEMSLPGEG